MIDRSHTPHRRRWCPIDGRRGEGNVATPQRVWGVADARRNPAERRSDETQAFYLVKFIFPRGDATGVLFGRVAKRKLTAVRIVSMAGDCPEEAGGTGCGLLSRLFRKSQAKSSSSVLY